MFNLDKSPAKLENTSFGNAPATEHEAQLSLHSVTPSAADMVSLCAVKTTEYIFKKSSWEVTKRALPFFQGSILKNQNFDLNPRAYLKRALIILNENGSTTWTELQIYRVPSKGRTLLWFPKWRDIAKPSDVLLFLSIYPITQYLYATNHSKNPLSRILAQENNPIALELHHQD